MNKKKYLNISYMILIFLVETFVCSILDAFNVDVLNFMIIYVLGILICSIIIKSITNPIVLSGLSVIAFNFFFTEPRFSLKIDDGKYIFTIVLFIIIGVIISLIVYKLKEYMQKTNLMKIEQIELQNDIEKEQIKTTMLKGLSHDLRTPLTTIKSGIDLLVDDNVDKEEKINLSSKMKQKCDWTINLMNNVLNLTRIDQDNLSVKKNSELIEEIISEALRGFEDNPKFNNIHIDLPEEIVFVPMDGILIIQVLHNIINNALRFIEDDGNIWLDVFNTNMNCIIRISNDGPLIKEKDLNHIFELYYTTENNDLDYGLGLSICKLIIEAHGGNISVYNSDNRVYFEFSLPLEEVKKC